jgi:hypothetical protein
MLLPVCHCAFALQEAVNESLMRYEQQVLLKEMQRLRAHLELGGGGDRARIEEQLRQVRLLRCCSLHCSMLVHPFCCLSHMAVAAAAAATLCFSVDLFALPCPGVCLQAKRELDLSSMQKLCMTGSSSLGALGRSAACRTDCIGQAKETSAGHFFGDRSSATHCPARVVAMRR